MNPDPHDPHPGPHSSHERGAHAHAHASPAGNATPASSAAQAPSAGLDAGTIYTCPMHPEIRQPAPGKKETTNIKTNAAITGNFMVLTSLMMQRAALIA